MRRLRRRKVAGIPSEKPLSLRSNAEPPLERWNAGRKRRQRGTTIVPGKVLTQGGASLLDTFNWLKSTHRLHAIAAHGPSSAASYTGVFLEVPHAEQRLDVDIPDYIVDQQITMRSVQGWQPVFMSATGDASGARYAVVYE